MNKIKIFFRKLRNRFIRASYLESELTSVDSIGNHHYYFPALCPDCGLRGISTMVMECHKTSWEHEEYECYCAGCGSENIDEDYKAEVIE